MGQNCYVIMTYLAIGVYTFSNVHNNLTRGNSGGGWEAPLVSPVWRDGRGLSCMARQKSELELALEGEFSSQSTHHIVELILRSKEYLQMQQVAFEDSFQREPLGAQVAALPEAERVRRAQRFYLSQIASLEARLSQWDSSASQQSALGLDMAAQELELCFSLYQEAVASLRGPVTHPGINSLWALLQTVPQLEGENRQYVQQQIASVCETEIYKAWTIGTTVDSSKPEPQVQLLIEFYTQLRELLMSESMAAAFDGGGELQPVLDRLVDLGKKYARFDVSGLARRYSHQPTAIAPMNQLIHGSWLVASDSIEVSAWQALHEHALSTLRDRVSAPSQLEPILKIVAQLPGSNDEDRKRVCDRLVELAQGLDRSAFGLGEVGSGVSEHCVCSICGLKNAGGLRKCRGCGGVLGSEPSAGALEGLAGADLTDAPRLSSLLQLAEGHLAGQNLSEQLSQACLLLQEELAVAMRSCPDGSGYDQGELAESVEIAGESYLTALENMAAGLEELAHFIHQPTAPALAQIRQQFSQSAALLAQVKSQVAPIIQGR